ncbi:MAG: LytR C-terminal domain-containing protein [Actinomycetota bacterium]|nr:LytR C-terminal domain-containing protein [Actinomycetota bacterium]
MSQYPRDEFDKVPENSSRQGVHRSSVEPVRRGLGPLIAFGIVALIIGALAFTVLPKLGFAGASASTTAASSPAAAGSSSTAGQSASAAMTSSVPATSPSPEASSAPATTPPAPGVDKSTPVSVLNASGVAGLAAKYSATVTAAGWSVNQTANWAGAAQPSSVIFYNGAAQKGNADALGSLLGITRLIDTAELQVPLAVVIGPGAN